VPSVGDTQVGVFIDSNSFCTTGNGDANTIIKNTISQTRISDAIYVCGNYNLVQNPRAKQAPVLSKGDLQSRSPSLGSAIPFNLRTDFGLDRFLGSVRDGIQDFLYWQRPASTATLQSALGTGKVSNITQTLAVRLR